MQFESERACLAYASFDLWMSRQLEQLVNRWIAYAAPCDQREASAWRHDRRASEQRPSQERD
jgi:hypothetical protein